MSTGQLLNLSDGSGTIGVGGPLDSKPQRRWHVALGTGQCNCSNHAASLSVADKSDMI